jgi:hypothetical protein
MKYKVKTKAAAIVATAMITMGTAQAMSAVEVIEYLNNDICITEAYHVKPLDNNPRGYTFLMRAEHWELTFGHNFPSANSYSEFDITCSSDVGRNWIPNYVPNYVPRNYDYISRMPPVPHIRVPRTPVPRTPVPRRGYSFGDLSSKGGDFRTNPNYHSKDTLTKYRKM